MTTGAATGSPALYFSPTEAYRFCSGGNLFGEVPMMLNSVRLAGVLAAVVVAVPASAATFVFAAPLSPEAVGATGGGIARVTFDTTLHTLEVKADWAGLSGTTTVAHIHCCIPAPGTTGVAVTPGTFPGFPVGVRQGSYSALLDLTLNETYTAAFRNGAGGTAAGAETRLLNGLNAQQAYLNIHTNRFPSGEIRGFLTAVPEPSAWAMLILGFGVIGTTLRLSRRTSPAFATG